MSFGWVFVCGSRKLMYVSFIFFCFVFLSRASNEQQAISIEFLFYCIFIYCCLVPFFDLELFLCVVTASSSFSSIYSIVFNWAEVVNVNYAFYCQRTIRSCCRDFKMVSTNERPLKTRPQTKNRIQPEIKKIK